MNIAFFGSSLVSAYWNGAATYYRGLIRAMHQRGHGITFYEPDAFDRQKHRDIDDPAWARVVVYSAETTDELRRCLDEARAADLIVKASGVGVFDELLEAEVLSLKRPGNVVAFWDVDAPATLDRVNGNPDDPFRQLIPQYDFVFTYGGGEPVVAAYRALGARHCVPIYNALDPATHHPVPPDERFRADVAFLGNRLPDRERRVEQFFLRAAELLPVREFLLGGSGWDDKPIPPNVRRAGHVYTRDHNAFNCSPLAVLNVSRESMARYGFSPATRVFEAAGAGACLITDWFEGIGAFLEPGREVLVARSGEEVAEHLDRLTPRRAKQLGAAALRRVLAEHTYDHRAAMVEEALGISDFKYQISDLRSPLSNRQSAIGNRQSFSIVILGLSITSSWGNGHATTYRALVRELVRREHRVLFLEHDKPWYAENRDLPEPPFGRTELYASVAELKQRFTADVRGADVVIVGSYVPQGIEVGQWVFDTAGGVKAFYDIDTPVTMAKLSRGECDYLSPKLIPRFDLYLSFTGGPMLRRIERDFGAPRARALYCSVDPELYFPEAVEPRWDLGYLGTYSDDRQPALERLLLEPARRWAAGRFIVAGPQYPDAIEWPGNVERVQHLPPAKHRHFYSRQRFTLNLTRADMRRAGFSPSVRLFEAAACAVPIISDWWEGLDELFAPDEQVLIARDGDGVLAILREMDDQRRRGIGGAAQQRVLREHTAARRAEELEQCLLDVLASEKTAT